MADRSNTDMNTLLALHRHHNSLHILRTLHRLPDNLVPELCNTQRKQIMGQ